MSAFVRILGVCLIGASLLGACGKRGVLDPPPKPEDLAAVAGQTNPDGTPKRPPEPPKRTPITAPKRDLPIDVLLD